MTDQPRILIAGAGPTELVLALGLARRGVAFRLIDAEPGPGAQSRAMAVHARTIEFYRQFGFADEVVAQGIVSEAIRLRARDADGASREIVRAPFGEIGRGLSRYQFLLTYPQDLHEKLLVEKLAAAGGSVEWGVRLAGLAQDEGGASARLERADGGVETARFGYVCGCDGRTARCAKPSGSALRAGSIPSQPPRKVRRTSGSASSAAPVSVKRLRPCTST